MTDRTPDGGFSRRQALRLGAAAGATGLAAGSPLLAGQATALAAPAAPGTAWAGTVAEIERIIRAKGTVSNGVLNIEIDRNDIPNVHKQGVPIKPAFEINGNLCF